MSVHKLKVEHDLIFVWLDRLSRQVNFTSGMTHQVRRDIETLLLEHCMEHFRFEEKVMKEEGYPDLQKHQQEHEQLHDRLRTAFKYMVDDNALMLLDFLRNSFIQHIIASDEDFLKWASSDHEEPVLFA